MSSFSPEIDCNCDNLCHVRFDERGDIVRCVNCGREFVSTNEDLVLVE